MEKALIIDLSGSRYRAGILSLDDEQPKVLESLELPVDSIPLSALMSTNQKEALVADEDTREVGTASLTDGEAQSAPELLPYLTETLSELLGQKEALPELSLLVLPEELVTTARLHFPFSTKQQVQGVLHYELQDQVPFRLDEFHYAFSLHPERAHSETEVPATIFLFPKEVLSSALTSLESLGVKPRVAVPASALLEGLPLLHESLMGAESIVYTSDPARITCAHLADGRLLDVKSFSRSGAHLSESQSTSQPTASRPILQLIESQMLNGTDPSTVQQLALSLGTKSLLTEIDHAYEQALASLTDDSPELRSSSEAHQHYLLGGAILKSKVWKDVSANFMAGEFGPRFPWKKLWRLLLKSRAAVLFFIVAATISFISVFASSQVERDRLEAALRIELVKTLGLDESLAESRSLSQLLRSLDIKIRSLKTGIETLSASANAQPFEILALVSKTLQEGALATVEISLFELNGNLLELRGEADSYLAVERFESRLRKVEQICSVRRKESNRGNVGAGRRNFTFEIELEDGNCGS